MSRLSILIPWREPSSAFETTLVSVLANRPTNAEIIVVHRGEYDDPYELRREVLLVEHDSDASLSDLLNRGLEVAGGQVLHLLTCGATVEDGWTEEARRRLTDDATLGSVTPLVVRNDRIVNSGVALSGTGRRKLLGRGRRVSRPAPPGWGPSLLAGFYRLSAVRDVGGFSPEVGELVDIDVAACLRAAGYSASQDPDCQVHFDSVDGDGGLEPNQSAADPVRHQERLFWRHVSMLGWMGALTHGLCESSQSLVDLVSGKASHVGARVSAMLGRSSNQLHRAKIAEAAERCGQDSTVVSLEEERQRRRGGKSSRRAA